MIKTILICGGRDFADYHLLQQTINKIRFGERGDRRIDIRIIHGGAKGADAFAAAYATATKTDCRSFPADWDQYGKGAGPIRNHLMLWEGNPDLVVAFPGGRGTANMVMQARHVGVEVVEIAARPAQNELELADDAR